ncbi:LysE family transporter [Collimonas pratensis]|uniref:LysE family transporter n=1 Tax=Collimonas pratensis TaxID=279113 RepID=UPI00143CD8ED|nr:LysE family transporter [Collimonas pratensis]
MIRFFTVASIVQSSPLACDVLRYAGAIYLIWRGVQLILHASSFSAHLATNAAITSRQALKDGVVASIINPKGMIFLLAFLPQFVDPSAGSVTLQLIALGLLMKVVALAVESGIALGAGTVGRLLLRWPKFVLWQERMTGVILIGLGLRLLTMDSRTR